METVAITGGNGTIEPQVSEYPWFALQTRFRYEGFVARHLRGRGFAPFLPVYKCRRRWSDRAKEIELPLFPGYLFCRFDPHQRLPILSTPGLLQVVGTGKTPTPVEESQIAAVEQIVKSGLPRQPWPFLKAGQSVRINNGPLSGLEGVLLSFKGSERLVVSVNLLQRSVAVDLDRAWVVPATDRHGSLMGTVLSPAA
jgi:transcription antitermination factor NusG